MYNNIVRVVERVTYQSQSEAKEFYENQVCVYVRLSILHWYMLLIIVKSITYWNAQVNLICAKFHWN